MNLGRAVGLKQRVVPLLCVVCDLLGIFHVVNLAAGAAILEVLSGMSHRMLGGISSAI